MPPLVLILLLLLLAVPARAAPPLVADLSRHLVPITTGFTGTDVLLFGAVESAGDVVVVVRGPARDEVIRRKDRVAGIWINTARATALRAPSFYQVASTRRLAVVAPPEVLQQLHIGLDHLDFEVAASGERAAWREAFIRLKASTGFYGASADVDFLGNRLFRTEIHFPADVPVGTYLVEVFLLRAGKVVGVQTTPLIVSKVGVGARLYDFAHSAPVAYGLASVVLAAAAGWLAAALLRKG